MVHACMVVRVEGVRRREALLRVLLSGVAAAAPVFVPAGAWADEASTGTGEAAPPVVVPAEAKGTAESTLLPRASTRASTQSVPVCLFVPWTAVLISSVWSTDKCRRRNSVRTRMRSTSSKLRFHKVKRKPTPATHETRLTKMVDRQG